MFGMYDTGTWVLACVSTSLPTATTQYWLSSFCRKSGETASGVVSYKATSTTIFLIHLSPKALSLCVACGTVMLL